MPYGQGLINLQLWVVIHIFKEASTLINDSSTYKHKFIVIVCAFLEILDADPHDVWVYINIM